MAWYNKIFNFKFKGSFLKKVSKTILGFVRTDSPYSGMRLATVLMVSTACLIIVGTFIVNAILIYQEKTALLPYHWMEAAGFAATGLTGKYWQKREEVKLEQSKNGATNNGNSENIADSER